MDYYTAMRNFDARCDQIVQQRKDYNQGGVDVWHYFPHRDISYHQMIHLKTMRLQALVKGEGSEEKILESLIDLVNYARFWGADLLQREHSNGNA